MKNTRILVAEDDTNIRNGLVDTLESEGYTVVPATDGEQAVKLFMQDHIDLVVLDIMMPGMSGYDVCRDLRAKNETVPIIMLTAKSEEIDKVVGLQLGADDYVTKPFGVHELLARISAVLRRARRGGSAARTTGSQGPDRFTLGPAEVDARQYTVKLGKRTADLTEREMKLLKYFRDHPNEVLSRDELLNAVWGIDYLGTTRTLDQHIAQLRKKVEAKPSRPAVIATVHGVGYKFMDRTA